ncbi:MAG: NosD domain-containing protein, partial [Methanofollis sp.]|nr:NosD domain-containing protein [Methanofollis sp.]
SKPLTLRGDAGATVNGGITISTGADGATVEGLAVNGAAGSAAIEVNWAADVVVRGCTVSGGETGISIESATNCTVEECTLDDTITFIGIALSGSGKCRILDNTVNGSGGFGIGFMGNSPDCIISGNSVQDCDSAGIQLQSGCQGSVVVANILSNNPYGIVVMGCTGKTTVLRDNTIVGARDKGVSLSSGTDSLIVENVTVRGGGYGVELSSVDNITLANSTITGTGTGLSVESTTTDSLIANNLFNNTKNIKVRVSTTMTGTRWNTTKTAGENIGGGSFLGGNLWLTPAGTGFSETHADFDLDGICDEGYAITDGYGTVVGTDNLPLQNGGPSANFTVASPVFMAGMPVSFNDTSVGDPTSWSWTFGDETLTTRNVTRTYDREGTYLANLTVANAFGTNTTTRTVTVEPFSIQGAVDAAPGDIVLVPAGTYDEDVTVDKNITLRGSEGAVVNGKISLTNTATGATVEHLAVNGVAGFSTITVNADDAVVRECTISGGQKGIDLYSAENCTVERCSVSGATDGISLYYSMGQSRILDNQVTGCGCFGIVLRDCPDCIISGNSVQNCDSSGIQLQSGCQGAVVESNTCSHNNNGITVTGCAGTTTVVRDNTIIEDRNFAVTLQSGDSVIVENITAKDGNYGVSLIDVENITITNSAFTGFTRYGLYVPIGSSAPHSLIANNLFNNSENFYLSSSADLSNIRWNTTKTEGTNIRGGPFLGGNLWLTPAGTGFSETHADFDGDGICDEGYAITDDNGDVVGTDSLPLQNGGPSANFSVTSPTFMVGMPISFNDTSVGAPTSWSWDFGDETETAQNVTRTYDVVGTYQATLTVENEFGTNTTSRTLDVVPYTIQGAVNAASEGDVVLVPSGTYNEDVTVDKCLTLRGSEGAALNGEIEITADGATVENLTVNGVVGSTVITVNAADAVVRGCTIWDGGDGIRITSAPNCTVEGCTLGGTLTGNGIYLYSAGQSRILDNQMTGCGGFGIILYSSCPGCFISGNTVQDCKERGIQLQSGCQGSVVISNTCSGNNGGLKVSGCEGQTTILRDNTLLENNYYGVSLEKADSVIVENVTVKDGTSGISLTNVENITLTNSTFTGLTSCGLSVYPCYSATNSLIANNLFNNTWNVYIPDTSELTGTRWNTTKTFGKNIRGGPFLGGNLWLTPEGTGFSETHEDLNGDGICDEGYDLGNGCTDSLPLHTCLPTADFIFAPTGGSTPLEVQFTETCSGVNPRLYHWDFGDNTPAVEFVHPSHTFTTNGTHQVSLTVENAF